MGMSLAVDETGDDHPGVSQIRTAEDRLEQGKLSLTGRLTGLKVVLQCALRMTWRGVHPTVKRLAGAYPDGVRVPAKEMKSIEARLERSATLPDYDITIKPRRAEEQG
jgi:hypothetical protein